MKKLTVIAVITAVFLAAAGVAAFFFYKNVFQPPDERFVMDFIRKYPDKASLRIVRNDTVIADFRPDRMMPLASTAKIVIAIEFARQASEGMIDINEEVPLKDLDVFYIPKTDGGAHSAWLKHVSERKLVRNNAVSLLEVGKGMVAFSSNANTEYLMAKLGLARINQNLKTLGLTQHEPLYPFVSALYLFRNKEGLPDNQFLTMMKQMSMSEYVAESMKIHETLKHDRDSLLRRTFVFPSLDLQRIWSDRLPRSTAAAYASLLKTIDRKTYFPESVRQYLDTLLEWPMEMNPKNKERFLSVGGICGSTAFVLTYALYACDRAGNFTEMVTFFDGLALIEGQRLRTALNSFQLNVLSKDEFRRDVRETLSLLR
jgi:D-alanyl-D-alanine carboxypeptidase